MYVKGRNQLLKEKHGFNCDGYQFVMYQSNSETRQQIQVAHFKHFSTRSPISAALIQRQLGEHIRILLNRHLKVSRGKQKLPRSAFLYVACKTVFKKSSL